MLPARPAQDDELKPSKMPPFPIPKGCAVAFGTDDDELGAPAADGHGGNIGVACPRFNCMPCPPGAITAAVVVPTAAVVVLPFGKAMGGICPNGTGAALSMA